VVPSSSGCARAHAMRRSGGGNDEELRRQLVCWATNETGKDVGAGGGRGWSRNAPDVERR
jgi:hypothetical protein